MVLNKCVLKDQALNREARREGVTTKIRESGSATSGHAICGDESRQAKMAAPSAVNSQRNNFCFQSIYPSIMGSSKSLHLR